MFNTTIVDGVYINTAQGTYTFTDMMEYVRDNIHRWERGPLVWDLSQASLTIETGPIDRIRQQLSKSKDLAERRSNQRTAFVAPDDYAYGMFRVYCVFAEMLKYPLEMSVFRSLAEAKAWAKGESA
jgi:hypothetical protein